MAQGTVCTVQTAYGCYSQRINPLPISAPSITPAPHSSGPSRRIEGICQGQSSPWDWSMCARCHSNPLFVHSWLTTRSLLGQRPGFSLIGNLARLRVSASEAPAHSDLSDLCAQRGAAKKERRKRSHRPLQRTHKGSSFLSTNIYTVKILTDSLFACLC